MGGATSDSSIHGGSQAKTYWPLKPVRHAERRGFCNTAQSPRRTQTATSCDLTDRESMLLPAHYSSLRVLMGLGGKGHCKAELEV